MLNQIYKFLSISQIAFLTISIDFSLFTKKINSGIINMSKNWKKLMQRALEKLNNAKKIEIKDTVSKNIEKIKGKSSLKVGNFLQSQKHKIN